MPVGPGSLRTHARQNPCALQWALLPHSWAQRVFQVVPKFDAGLIEATAAGARLHAVECQTLIDQVDEAVQLTGIRCVLLEVGADHASAEPFQDKLRLANRLANDPTLTHTRFAYVAFGGAEIDPVIEVLAKAKGFQGQRFETRADALAWLMEAESPCTTDASSDARTPGG